MKPRAPKALPPELTQASLNYVTQTANDEFASACPHCGGVPHSNGEYPDRFRIWLHSKTTGGILGWCRQCGYVWTPRGEKLDPEQQRRWIEERENYELEQKARVERALQLLQQEKAWVRYHENLNDEARKLYASRGIDGYWLEYWMLGYNPQKTVWNGETEYKSPALTIPVFEPGTGRVLTIRNRLLNPPSPGDKYRPEYGGLPTSLYFTDKENKPRGKTLIVEGEFKAMTTYITADMPDLFVVGIPGKRPAMEMFEHLSDCEPVYILLDPDAYIKVTGQTSPVRRLVEYFGHRARVLSLPYKVDDMIMNGNLSKTSFLALIKNARKYNL